MKAHALTYNNSIPSPKPFCLNGCGEVMKEPETLNKIPGHRAIWVGIFAELSEFGLFFLVYLIAKAHYPEQFNQGPLHLNTLAGTANTFALITSSYFVAKALAAIRLNKPQQSINWLWGAVFCGCVYLVIKVWEYYWNAAQGIMTNTNNFFAVYYYLTFNHLLHVAWASGSLLWAIRQLSRQLYSTGSSRLYRNSVLLAHG